MTTDLKLSKYIPLDKSWAIRMGFRDAIVTNKSNTIAKLEQHHAKRPISDDLQALLRVLYGFKTANLEAPVSVGESATLYRFTQWFKMINGIEKEVLKEGTLLDREIAEPTHAMNNLSYTKLLDVNDSSQYASAKALFSGLQKKAGHYPYHLKMTVDANKHWDKLGSKWMLRLDDTIYRQVNHYTNGKEFVLDRAEHFCYAYMFDMVTVEDAKAWWPQLANHETNRLTEIVEQKQRLLDGDVITSLDHRVVQALFMYAKKNKLGCVASPEAAAAVNKSWPSFWEFIA